MWSPLPPLGWQYLRDDCALVVGEFLFRPGWVTLVTLAVLAFLWRAGGEELTKELARVTSLLVEKRRLVLCALILGSAGASAYLNLSVLGGHPHIQDEIAYLFQARTFASGHLTVATPPDGLLPAFQTVFLLEDHGRWYSKYPFGWPLFLAPFARLGLEWLANPLLNALALWLLHRILARHFSPGWALAGIALLATSPFFVWMGASFMTHPLTLVLLLFIVEGAERLPQLSGCALIACGTGLIHTVRPLDAVALGLPAYLLAFRAVWRSELPRGRALAVLVAVPVACFALVSAYNAWFTGHPLISPFLKHNPNDRPGFGPEMGTFAPEGHNAFKGVMNLALNMFALNEDLFGWPGVGLLVVIAGVVLPAEWSRLERLLLAAALLVGLQYFTFMGHGIAFGPRYYHAWLPLAVTFTLRFGLEVERRTQVQGRLALLGAMLTFIGFVTYWPARADAMRDYFNVLSRPSELMAGVPPDAGIVVVPSVRWQIRDVYDSYFGKNGIDLGAARPLFVRDGPWVKDGRLARAFPGRTIAALPAEPVRALIEPATPER